MSEFVQRASESIVDIGYLIWLVQEHLGKAQEVLRYSSQISEGRPVRTALAFVVD
jgi:hypothetical protein